MFGGKLCNQIICKACGKISNRIEDFYNLSLPVKDRKHIYESLDKLLEGEEITDFTCDGCNQKVTIHKRSLVSHCPNVLIVHLQRFAFNFDTFRNDKINTYFEFPQILDLTPYSFYDVMEKEEKKKPSPAETKNEEELWPEEDNCYEYKLVGVTIHTGTANAGHYYSYINTRRGAAEYDPDNKLWEQASLDPWKEFNDSSVTDFNYEKLENECFGGDGKEQNDFGLSMMSSSTYGKSGYMLVYERRVKKPIKVLVPKETAGAVFNEEKKEYYEWRSYNAQGKVVPNKIYKQVWEDNQYIVLEKNVNFVKAVKAEEAGGEADAKLAGEVNRTVARVGMRFALAILAKSNNNEAIKEMAAVMRETYKSQIDACRDFLSDMCQDRCAMLLDVLLECPDVPCRTEIASIVAVTLAKVFEAEKDQRAATEEVKDGEQTETLPVALSCRMLHFFIGALPWQAPSNWMKLPEFLSVFKAFGEASEDHMRYLFEINFIEKALDFILGRKSPMYKVGDKRPEMGGYSNQPNFGNLITLISTMQGSPLTKEHPLSEGAQTMLFMPQYMKQIFNAGSGCEEFGKSLAELCHENEKLSKRVCKMFVNGINNADYEKIENYSEALKPILTLNDSLKLKRLDWVFGYPEIYRWNRSDEIFKIGVDVIYRIGDDSFTYKSPIAGQNEDPLLYHMFRCRNKMEIFTCKLLKDVTDLMATDDDVARLMMNTMPPCYTYARFCDWIKVYLDQQLEEIQRSNLGSYYEQKEKKVRAALENWALFEAKQTKFEAEEAAKQQDSRVSEAERAVGVIEHFPAPAIYLKSYEQNLLERRELDNVILTVHEVICDWVYSKPTGTSNTAVPLDIFQKGIPPPPPNRAPPPVPPVKHAAPDDAAADPEITPSN